MTLPAERLVTTVYAFEWCDCVYESSYRVVSLHATKTGAYRAMRAKLTEAATEDRRTAIEAGRIMGRAWNGLQHQAWCVRTIEVLP